MNMPRYIFSYTLVIIFSLAAFLSLVPKPADADKPTCPCAFTSIYDTSIDQAQRLGLNNEVETCFENSDVLELGRSPDSCLTFLTLHKTLSICFYNIECFEWFLISSTGIDLSPEEVNACRFELELIARQSRISCE